MTEGQSGSASLEARIGLIEDRQAIHDVITRYSRGVDRGETALIIDAFHDDATDNHFGELLPFREAIASIRDPKMDGAANPPSPAMCRHQLYNILIDLDGDVARAETYFAGMTRLQHEGRDIDWLHNGRYVDRFERRGGEWRIASRSVVYDLERFDVVPPAPEGLGAARYLDKALHGMRGPTDWSYNEFKWTPRGA